MNLRLIRSKLIKVRIGLTHPERKLIKVRIGLTHPERKLGYLGLLFGRKNFFKNEIF